MSKYLRLYNKNGELLKTSKNIEGNTGVITIENLFPETLYHEGDFLVSWVINGNELSKAPVPEFRTLELMDNKTIVVYFSDITEEQLIALKGDSAYKIALDNGFRGTQQDWLDSLKGEPGRQGDPGKDGVDITEGGSAYEIAQAHGFEGTREEWLESLKGEPGEQGEPGKNGYDGLDGLDGDSAYDIAVYNGFRGNVQDFLESLKGNPGRDGKDFKFSDFTPEQLKALKGDKGEAFTYQDFTHEQLEELKGEPGKEGLSAYQVAVRGGYKGTEEEWLYSLKGKDGKDISNKVYTLMVDMQTPFKGKKLFITYNQLMVSIMLQGNADGNENNIKLSDALIAKLPNVVPLPKTEFVRGTITSMTGGEEIQYIGNLFMDDKRNIYVKFNKNASNVNNYFGGSLSYPIGNEVINFNSRVTKEFTFDNPNFLSMQGTDVIENYIFSAINKQKGDIQEIKYINTLDNEDKGTLTNLDDNFSELVGHANSLKILGKIDEEYLMYVVKTDTPNIIPIYVNMKNKTTRVGEGIITIQDEKNTIKNIISINSIEKVKEEYIFDVYWYGINFRFAIDELNKPITVSSVRTFSIDEEDIRGIRENTIGDFNNNIRITQGTKIYGNHFYLTQYGGTTSAIFKFNITDRNLIYENHWVESKGNLDRFEVQDIFKYENKIYASISEQSLEGSYSNYITEIVI